MAGAQKKARVIEGIAPDQIPFDELFASKQPIILRGLISGWPLVQAGLKSAESALDYLTAGYGGKPFKVYVGNSKIKGRFYYNESATSLNYHVKTMSLADVFASIKESLGREEHTYYFIPSLVFQDGFPALESDNNIVFDHEIFQRVRVTKKSWIGTESITGAHFDLPSNFACCAVGRRRFTLFPPDQVHNLYPGPIHLTPGGQVTTMVDIRNPDFERYPRFRAALDAAVVADLEPGDGLYYPSMWWHEVESKDRFNAMINHWWYAAPRYMADPMDVVMHAILGLRDRPEIEKQAWRELFDYYVFGPADKPRAHLPEDAHGVLAELDETMARRLRAALQQTLNR